ncbi:MFS transporter [Apilactobacillus apisilvae]|uniref:MFS transporter n=1 Tax=Apilactobacillus apisilvae TaxID=2923364 RepID=A0ABY4PH34_9LACO|nr:MFS transporter [Apilactobacillus apisilvae]UQS84786.1 MFS transporter [Apilactobacillus apisilvae]
MKERISRSVLLAIVAVGVMTFSGVTVETSMNITFPTLISEFHIGLNVVQWITTIYLLVLSSVIPLSKFLKSRFKTSHLFIFSNVLFIIGLLVDAFAPSFVFILLGRVIQGVGTGIALPLMFNIILENVPKSRLGFMMGFGSLITAAASAVGPTFGGIIVNTLGWRYIFIILIPVLVMSLILGIIAVPKLVQNELSNDKFDIVSFILIVLTFAGLIVGISNISSRPLLDFYVLLPILIGIIALTVFVKMQNRKQNPILRMNILKNGSYSKYVVAFFINQLIILGLSFVVPNYVQIINHSSSSIAGLILLPGAVMGAIISPFSGSLLDRFGAKKPILSGVAAIIVSLVYLTINSYSLTDIILTVFYTVIMIGIGLSYGNIMTKGLDYLSPEIKADGNAILTTVQQFAGAIGTVIVSTIVTKVTAVNPANPIMGYTFALVFLAVISVIEFVVVFSTKESK